MVENDCLCDGHVLLLINKNDCFYTHLDKPIYV